MKALHVIAWILLIIGGLNWGLVGIFEWDLVAAIFGGSDAVVSKIVYILVGLSALVELFSHKKGCGTCSTDRPAAAPAQDSSDDEE